MLQLSQVLQSVGTLDCAEAPGVLVHTWYQSVWTWMLQKDLQSLNRLTLQVAQLHLGIASSEQTEATVPSLIYVKST